jgi:hypothetical protein
MKLRQLWAVVVLLSCSSYSYSEEVYGTSTNAANAGLNWVMTNILPQQTGLTVNGVVYRYTTVKNAEDEMLVHVQNEDAINGGYIFRETDDWSGLPGNTINKLVPVSDIPIQYWGDGSIEVEGKGEVIDATVLYNYRYDTCFEVTDNPECPGYIPPLALPDVEAYDPMKDQFVRDELEKEAEIDDEDERERQRRKVAKEKKRDERLEAILGVVNNSLLAAEQQAKHNELMSLNYVPSNYYATLPDTKYEETVVLKDANLPDNRKARRQNVAQQLLHQQMVNLQYEK